jgi:hypothetical protein
MFIFFDDPNDICISYFSNYKSVTTIACTPEHWGSLNISNGAPIEVRQIANANYALKLAIRGNYSWLIHIDVDELIYSKNPLKSILSNVPNTVPVIAFKTLEAIPIKNIDNSIFAEIKYFKVYSTSKIKKFIAYALGCKSAFDGGYFKAHIDGKAAVRTNAEITSIDIHRPKVKGLKKYAIADNIHLLHYECCEYQAWFNKWKRRYDGTATATNMGPDRKRQYESFVSALGNGEPALMTLYRSLYMIPKYKIFILRMLGLAKRISIHNSMFNYI